MGILGKFYFTKSRKYYFREYLNIESSFDNILQLQLLCLNKHHFWLCSFISCCCWHCWHFLFQDERNVKWWWRYCFSHLSPLRKLKTSKILYFFLYLAGPKRPINWQNWNIEMDEESWRNAEVSKTFLISNAQSLDFWNFVTL